MIEAKTKIGFFYNYCQDNLGGDDWIGWNRGSFAFEIDDKNVVQVYSFVYPKESLAGYQRQNDSLNNQNAVLRFSFKNKTIAEIYFDGYGYTSSFANPKGFKDKQIVEK